MQASQLASILGCQSHCCASRRMRRLNRIFVGESLSFAYLDPVTIPEFNNFTSRINHPFTFSCFMHIVNSWKKYNIKLIVIIMHSINYLIYGHSRAAEGRVMVFQLSTW